MWGREWVGVCEEGRRPLGVLDSEVEGTGLSELLPWKQESRLFVFLGTLLFYLNKTQRKPKTVKYMRISAERQSLYIFCRRLGTCLSAGCALSALEDREGCRLLSSELQRDSSGDRRRQRSLERPRSLSPCCQCSDRETGGHTFVGGRTTPKEELLFGHVMHTLLFSCSLRWLVPTNLLLLVNKTHCDGDKSSTNQQLCSFGDGVYKFAQGFSPPPKGR